MPLSEIEFDAISSIFETEVTLKQLNSAIHRTTKCRDRLQLRFPSVFRDGAIIQFLLKYIENNETIHSFACGLSSNYSEGYYALNRVLRRPQFTSFNLRILNLSLAPNEFFEAISLSKMKKFFLKFDDISNDNMKALCLAMSQNTNLKDLSFSCNTLTDEAVTFFADFCKLTTVKSMSISMDFMSVEQVKIMCDGIIQSQYIEHLDIENCKVNYDGMKAVMFALKKCQNITTFTIGNNGENALNAVFEEFGTLPFVKKLICNESHSQNVKLDIVASALSQNEVLSVLQLPLFIFEETTYESLESFVDALASPKVTNRIEVLELFPLFEHLDIAFNEVLTDKISHFFNLLFLKLGFAKNLRKLYVEMIGSETTFWDEKVAKSFGNFLKNTNVNELYLPFCYLVDLNNEILSDFVHNKKLIAIKDDTLNLEFLYDEKKKNEQIKARKYHKIAHKQCRINVSEEIIKFIPIKDIANEIASFCGFNADPDDWLLE